MKKLIENKNVLKYLYIKIVIYIVELLEYIINNRSLLTIYKYLYHVHYLYPIYCILINIIPFIYLIECFNLLIPGELSVSFIADGNRRYLRKMNKNIEQVKKEGMNKMCEIIAYCSKLNFKEVGFYCFSINNFKRSDIEVNNLLDIFKYKPDITSYKVKVYGNMTLLPQQIQDNLMEIVYKTRNNNGLIINLFIAYSSQDEVLNGVQYTGNVDLIVRTSGEKRLSDFLILKCREGTSIFFADVLWPELTVFHVYLIILKYRIEKIFFN